MQLKRPPTSTFFAIDYRPHYTDGIGGESWKTKRLTHDGPPIAIHAPGQNPASQKAQRVEFWMRKERLEEGGFSADYVGFANTISDNPSEKPDLEVVFIKEVPLQAPEGAQKAGDTSGGKLDATSGVKTKSKPHRVTLDKALREPALMQHFKSPQGPMAVLLNEKQTKMYIVQRMMAGSMVHHLDAIRNLSPQARFMFLMYTQLEQLVIYHADQTVHRDIKPGNILLDKTSENMVVADLGEMALHAEVPPGSGSPRYQSPEQRIKDGPNMGQKSDIFQAATVVAESLISAPQLFTTATKLENGTECRLLDNDGFQQERFCAWWANPQHFAAEDPEAARHFETAFNELADQLKPEQFALLAQMLHPNPEGRPSAVDALNTVKSIGVSEEQRQEVTDFWEQLPAYTQRTMTIMSKLYREILLIKEHRDHPHAQDYFNELRKPKMQPPQAISVETMLEALNSQTPYEREMGPRINQRRGVTNLSADVMNKKVMALAWRVWYSEGIENEAPELLRVALQNRNHNGAKLLLGSGLVNPAVIANGDTNMVWSALHAGYTDVARMLLLQGAGPDRNGLSECLGITATRMAFARTPQEAAQYYSLIPLLLELGADPNVRNGNGRDLMYLACKHGSLELTNLLMRAGAQLFNPKGDNLWVPEEYQGHPLMCDELRSYALFLPAIFSNDERVAERAPKIADMMVKFQPELGNLSLIAVLHEFLQSIGGRDSMVAWCDRQAAVQGYSLPGRLSEEDRAAYRGAASGIDPITGQPTVVPTVPAPQKDYVPRVLHTQVASTPPTPGILGKMSDEHRTVFGRGRAALYLGNYRGALEAMNDLVEGSEAARLHRACAFVGLRDFAAAKADCDRVAQSRSESLRYDALNTRSLVNALTGAWQAVVDDCDALLKMRALDQTVLRRRSLAYTQLGNAMQSEDARSQYHAAAMADFAQVRGVRNGVVMRNGVPAHRPHGGHYVYLTLA